MFFSPHNCRWRVHPTTWYLKSKVRPTEQWESHLLLMCSIFLSLKAINILLSNGEVKHYTEIIKIIFIIMAMNDLFYSQIITRRLMLLVKWRVVPLQLKLSSCFHANVLEFEVTWFSKYQFRFFKGKFESLMRICFNANFN